MKIYIAAPYPCQQEAIFLMRYLEASGHVVTSRWLREIDSLDDASARKDLLDVEKADVLLAMNPESWEHTGTGGRHVEFGYALALNKSVILLGKPSNIFHHLALVKVVNNHSEVFQALLDIARGRDSIGGQ